MPIPNSKKDNVLIEFIKHIERNIDSCHELTRTDIRNKSIPILRNFCNNSLSLNDVEKLIKN
jgi:hypothetical protein